MSNTMVVIEQVVRLARLLMRENVSTLTHTQVISCGELVDPWCEGSYQTGDVRRYEGVIYECAQGHDSTGNPSWNPKEAVSLWFAWHSDRKEFALPWVQPTGAHDQYREGEYMVWTDGQVYYCKQDTVYDPETYAQAWEVAV